MAYCTSTDIENAIGADAVLRAFDRDGDGTADAAAYTAAIAWADAMIDAKLAASHGTPFTDSVAVLVREIAIDLAVYRVVSGNPGVAAAVVAPYRQRYADAVALLKDLAKDQTARLPSGPPSPVSTVVATADASVEAASSFWGDPNACDGFGGPGGF